MPIPELPSPDHIGQQFETIVSQNFFDLPEFSQETKQSLHVSWGHHVDPLQDRLYTMIYSKRFTKIHGGIANWYNGDYSTGTRNISIKWHETNLKKISVIESYFQYPAMGAYEGELKILFSKGMLSQFRLSFQEIPEFLSHHFPDIQKSDGRVNFSLAENSLAIRLARLRDTHAEAFRFDASDNSFVQRRSWKNNSRKVGRNEYLSLLATVCSFVPEMP